MSTRARSPRRRSRSAPEPGRRPSPATTRAGAGRDATFRGRLARVATTHRPPLGFLRRLTVEHRGEHRGQLDLKKGALLPVADPEHIARTIANRLGGASGMRYLPGWWGWVMRIFAALPWPVFKRLDL